MTKENQMKQLWGILLIVIFSLFTTMSAFAVSFQGVNYTIIEKSNLGNIKNSIDIRLKQKVSKDFLHKLALKLRQEEPIKYDRMFISYYLQEKKKKH